MNNEGEFCLWYVLVGKRFCVSDSGDILVRVTLDFTIVLSFHTLNHYAWEIIASIMYLHKSQNAFPTLHSMSALIPLQSPVADIRAKCSKILIDRDHTIKASFIELVLQDTALIVPVRINLQPVPPLGTI